MAVIANIHCWCMCSIIHTVSQVDKAVFFFLEDPHPVVISYLIASCPCLSYLGNPHFSQDWPSKTLVPRSIISFTHIVQHRKVVRHSEATQALVVPVGVVGRSLRRRADGTPDARGSRRNHALGIRSPLLCLECQFWLHEPVQRGTYLR